MANDFVLGPKPEGMSMDTESHKRAPSPVSAPATKVAVAAETVLGVRQVNEAATVMPVKAPQIAAIKEESAKLPDCQQIIQSVANILNDPSPANVPLAPPRIGTLVINKPAEEVSPPVLSPFERLHKAALSVNRDDFKNAVLALPKEQASRVIKELLVSLDRSKDFVHYCFVYSEVMKLLPHFSSAEYLSVPVTANDLKQDKMLRKVSYQVFLDCGDFSKIKALESSLKEAFCFLHADKKLQGHIGELLTGWAKEGNSTFYLEGLRELSKLYTPEEFRKLVKDSISEFLTAKIPESWQSNEEYCALLKELGKIVPDFYVLEDENGLLRTSALQFVRLGLQTEGVLPADRPADLCESLFSEKQGADAKKMVKNLLQEVAKRADPLLYGFVLHELARAYPQISTVVDPVGTLRPDGIRAILAHLQAKGSVAKEFSCSVCESVLNGADVIKEKVKEANSTRFSVIVRHPGSSHVTPILLEKVEGKWRALVTDSMGTKNSTYNDMIKSMLEVAIPGVMVYPFKMQRQSASAGCPLFAILDIAQFSKTPDLMKFAMDHFSEKEQEVTELPPKMMRPTQSLSRLTEYMVDKGSGKEGMEKMRERRAAIEGSLLKHVVKLLTSKGLSKEQNALALHRFNKYSQMLVSDVIMNAGTGKEMRDKEMQRQAALNAIMNEADANVGNGALQPGRNEDAAARKAALDAIMNEDD